MSKVKAPLLSLGASGTLANRLTYRRSSRQNVALEIPTHPDARSWAQIYHRWTYQDACFYWHTLSSAQQDAFLLQRKNRQESAFNAFLRYYFANLPDLAAHYHCDSVTGSVLTDFSKNVNDGAVFGASAVSRLFNNSLLLDGIDDRVRTPHHSSLNVTQITLEAWLIFYAGNSVVSKWDSGALATEQYSLIANPGFSWELRLHVDGSDLRIHTPNPPQVGVITNIIGTYDGTCGCIYIDGTLVKTTVSPGSIHSAATDLTIGSRLSHGVSELFFDGFIDEVTVYTRAISAAHALIHSRRRKYFS